MKKFLIRITTCWKILTRKYDHWFLYNINEGELIKLLQGNDSFDITGICHGVRPFVINEIIRQAYLQRDEIDRALDRAEFEANAEITNSNPHAGTVD